MNSSSPKQKGLMQIPVQISPERSEIKNYSDGDKKQKDFSNEIALSPGNPISVLEDQAPQTSFSGE